MKKNLLKQISALIITAMLFSASANAQIVYTDVNPDTTVTCSTPPCSNSYNLDLNNDGTNDFVINHSFGFAGCAFGRAYQNYIWVTPLATNQVVGYSGFSATKMTPNAIINATVLTWNDSVNQSMAIILSGFCTGQA